MFRGFRGEKVKFEKVERENLGPNIAEPVENKIELNYEPIWVKLGLNASGEPDEK